jgi:hypothetical protein
MPLPRRLVAALPLLALLPFTLTAQVSALVDDGTFTISKKGAPVGREAFRITRLPGPGGQVFRGSGTTVLENRRYTTVLGTDSVGVPLSYEARLAFDGKNVRIEGRGRPGRFSVLSSTAGGESAREYVLQNGALLMEEEVFLHYFFVPLASASSHITVIVPREAQQSALEVTSRGSESVEIAGKKLPGRRFSISSDGVTRDVWVDALGRLLKVSIPEKELVALRDDPPR